MAEADHTVIDALAADQVGGALEAVHKVAAVEHLAAGVAAAAAAAEVQEGES